MSSRTLTILFAVFLAFLAFVLLQFAAPTLFAPKQSAYQKALPAITPEKIQTITIGKSGQSFHLVNKDGTWSVNGKPAAKEKVTELFTQLIQSPKAEVVAQTNTRHTDLELTDALATSIAFDKTLTLLAGKSGIDGTYVRIKDNDTVYLLSNVTASTISTSLQDWYDKTVLKTDESSITKLSFVKPAEQFAVVHDNGNWKLADSNQEVNRDALQGVFTDLSSFQAQSLADEATAAAYPTSPDLSLTIEKKDNKEGLEFFKGASDYLVKRSSDNQRFIIPEFQAKHFLLTKSEILKQEPTATPKP